VRGEYPLLTGFGLANFELGPLNYSAICPPALVSHSPPRDLSLFPGQLEGNGHGSTLNLGLR